MSKKYELTDNTYIHNSVTLYQIRALKDFSNVKAGELGGYVQSTKNLSQKGKCWIYNDDSMVYGNAIICGNAKIMCESEVCDNAKVSENATISDSIIFGSAIISGNASISDNVKIHGVAKVYDNAQIRDNVCIRDSAIVCECAFVANNVEIYDNAIIKGNAGVIGDPIHTCNSIKIYGTATLQGDCYICNGGNIYNNNRYAVIKGFGREQRSTTFYMNRNNDIMVKCGCFFGTLKDFRNEVRITHGYTKLAKEYLKIAKLMEYHFK